MSSRNSTEQEAEEAAESPETLATRRAELLKLAKDASTDPGVYLMKDNSGLVIYVGKAKNLKNRITTYFQPARHEIFRTEMMVCRVRHFETVLTKTETEALLLENTLIKKYKPKFNVRLKDDKAYPYLKINLNEAFPRIEWTRKVLKDGARYFGPFPSAAAARMVMNLMNERFRLRDCSDNTFRHRSRPCILYQMQKCSAPCVAIVSEEDYRVKIEQVMAVLGGKAKELIAPLKAEMKAASERDEFEIAAEIRDQIQAIELVTQTQGVLAAGSDQSSDVVAISRKEANAHFTVIQVRAGRLVAVRHFHLQNVDATQPEDEVFESALEQCYLQEPDEKNEMPEGERRVLIAKKLENADWLSEALDLKFAYPRSAADRQLIAVAQANADYALEQSLKKQTSHGIEALEDVQSRLGLQEFPHRIECFDISNIQGSDSVASRVVFIEGAPDKNLYRRYKIKTVEGQNDFAMMKEVLGRRFANDESLPDLVVVDGGKGQLAQAVAILDELSVQGVSVVGLAKARTESDFQEKEVKASAERVFIPNRKNPVVLLPHQGAFRLLTHIRDEAHRFAVSYHRLTRSKRTLGK